MNVHFSFRRMALPFILLCLTPLAQSQAFAPTRFTVVDAGTAGKPDVILIPGLNSSHSVWDAEVKLLSPKYRLHLVQLNGFAGQAAGPNADGPMLPAVEEELHSYIDANKLHPVIIGHSVGGLLALMLADKHPADVSKMVIVDALPFYALIMKPDATIDNTKDVVKAMSDMLVQLKDDQFAAAQSMVAMQMVKNDDGRKLVIAGSVASDRGVAIKAMVEDMSTDLRLELPNIKTPTLLLYPYEARQSDPAKVDALYHDAYKGMPNITLKRVDDSLHFIMYDQPAAMDTAIQAFLQ